MLAYTTFVAVFGSSIFSAAITSVAKEFGVGREVGTLGTSLYVLGKQSASSTVSIANSARFRFRTNPLGPLV